jgi:serine/threonine-protein kinase
MAAAIDDPNIIPIYEADEIDGAFYLAMRFVEGTDLESRLRLGPFEPREAVHVLAQVASALDAAHARGLVHRDVKPGNVLIAAGSTLDRPDHVYLTDFGLTKHRGTQTAMTGGFLGTLAYIAPEQIEGRDVDGRADQYSLACMAFECLTGAPPFTRPNDVAVINAHLHDRPPSAHATAAVPTATDTVLGRAMAKRPADRYGTCGAFIDALRDALGVRPTEAHPAPPSGRPRWLPIAAGLVVVLIAASAAAIFVSGAFDGRQPANGDLPTNDASAPSVAGSSSPSATLSAVDEHLVAWLPSDLPTDCVRGSETLLPTRQGPSLKPLGHVVCQLPGGSGPSVIEAFDPTFPLSSTPADGPKAFRASDVVIGMATELGAQPGDCRGGRPGQGAWRQGKTPGVEEWLLCATDDDAALLAWSVDDSALYVARDESGPLSALHAWWLDNRNGFGPNERPDFPTIDELRLIAAIPTDADPDCVPGDGRLLPTLVGLEVKPRGHVSCRLLGGAGPDVIEGFDLTTGTDVRGWDVVDRLARDLEATAGPCGLTGAASEVWQADGDDRGAVVCYADAETGDAVITWSQDDFVLYRAVASDGDRAGLLRWWQENAPNMAP